MSDLIILQQVINKTVCKKSILVCAYRRRGKKRGGRSGEEGEKGGNIYIYIERENSRRKDIRNLRNERISKAVA